MVAQSKGREGQRSHQTYGDSSAPKAPIGQGLIEVTGQGQWEKNHIFLDPTLVPPSLRDKNPYKTIEKGALLPPPSCPGSYLLSCNNDFACLLPVCSQSSFFSCVNKNLIPITSFQHQFDFISDVIFHFPYFLNTLTSKNI